MKALLLASILALAGCRADPTDAEMSALTQELRETFSNEIVAISFVNSPPLDPLTIYVDTSPSITREDTVRWLCDQVRPHVDAIDTAIEVAATYADLRTDCPSR